MRRSFLAAGLVAAVGLVGCGPDTPVSTTTVDVTGTLTDAGGKPLKDVSVGLYPASLGAQPSGLKVAADGTLSGKVVAGDYLWSVAPVGEAKGAELKRSEAAVKAMPAGYAEPDQNRKVTIRAGEKLALQVK